jgi:hypothetical protein
MFESLADGVFARRSFLGPLELLKIIEAANRLTGSWAPSETLGLLGRSGTHQVRADTLAARHPLDAIRETLAMATLRWAKACGFGFVRPPRLQLFPVRMVGDRARPARQEPHRDSMASEPGAPICTSVFYVRANGVEGGELAVAPPGGPESGEALIVRPTANMMVTFGGERVHWVQPLYAGERLSVVVNLY